MKYFCFINQKWESFGFKKLEKLGNMLQLCAQKEEETNFGDN